ncbi:hypothetical protein ABK249_29145 [Neorhizobium sp. Rsf11]|uniref:Uncharacterized protein n=2 Tax=Neorhizobium TaxID=1525371 RepID=A0ABV0MCZ8_9HYPH|nr:hypothetical protein [Neorhizobium petrolearium]WGI71379.1 hypothetical protein QEO92_14795 [Neorhizobium petrolearium]
MTFPVATATVAAVATDEAPANIATASKSFLNIMISILFFAMSRARQG